MLTFLSGFTPSFLAALLLWPFVAFALTLPILIVQYRRYNRLYLRRAVGMYFFIFYLLGLVCFTLYPLPENAEAFCRQYQLTPQLNPLQFIQDIQSDGLRAILQIIMNFIFFLPMGVFLRLLFRVRMRVAFAASFTASLLIEVAQLTGVFGVYPCSYRLFDINDVALNTSGGIAGYLLAMLMPRRELEKAQAHDVVRRAGLVRHFVALVIDTLFSMAMTVGILLAIYVIAGKDQAMVVRDALPVVTIAVVFGVLPYALRGWSLGGMMVRLNHDDTKRRVWRRTAYYIFRTLFVALLLLPRGEWEWVSWLMVGATIAIWWKYHKLPYQLMR